MVISQYRNINILHISTYKWQQKQHKQLTQWNSQFSEEQLHLLKKFQFDFNNGEFNGKYPLWSRGQFCIVAVFHCVCIRDFR